MNESKMNASRRHQIQPYDRVLSEDSELNFVRPVGSIEPKYSARPRFHQ